MVFHRARPVKSLNRAISALDPLRPGLFFRHSFSLPGGVMVAQATLTRLVMVRIHAGQPICGSNWRPDMDENLGSTTERSGGRWAARSAPEGWAEPSQSMPGSHFEKNPNSFQGESKSTVCFSASVISESDRFETVCGKFVVSSHMPPQFCRLAGVFAKLVKMKRGVSWAEFPVWKVHLKGPNKVLLFES